jgi:hypothetical protein
LFPSEGFTRAAVYTNLDASESEEVAENIPLAEQLLLATERLLGTRLWQ